jgi:hypothetical protein
MGGRQGELCCNELSRNRALHAEASRLGEQIRTEKGIDNAVGLIQEAFGEHL